VEAEGNGDEEKDKYQSDDDSDSRRLGVSLAFLENCKSDTSNCKYKDKCANDNSN
jgi:hypothetical protein